jgi:hypothetical protein
MKNIDEGDSPMQTVTVSQIAERLRVLPAEKLAVVYDFVSYLSESELAEIFTDPVSKTIEFALASEPVLRRDWDRPEEDAAQIQIL